MKVVAGSTMSSKRSRVSLFKLLAPPLQAAVRVGKSPPVPMVMMAMSRSS
jgi:hypothetical protein